MTHLWDDIVEKAYRYAFFKFFMGQWVKVVTYDMHFGYWAVECDLIKPTIKPLV